MCCAVKLCERECSMGDYFCAKHRRRFAKALARGTGDNWRRSNQVRIPDGTFAKIFGVAKE